MFLKQSLILLYLFLPNTFYQICETSYPLLSVSSTIWKEKKLRLAAVVNFNNLSPKTQLVLAEEAYIVGYKCSLTHSTCRRHERSELVMFTLKFAQDTFTVLYHREKCTLRALHLSQCYTEYTPGM